MDCRPTAAPRTSDAPPPAPGVVLTELRAADGAGLEEMFLTLTADDARERVTEDVPA